MAKKNTKKAPKARKTAKNEKAQPQVVKSFADLGSLNKKPASALGPTVVSKAAVHVPTAIAAKATPVVTVKQVAAASKPVASPRPEPKKIIFPKSREIIPESNRMVKLASGTATVTNAAQKVVACMANNPILRTNPVAAAAKPACGSGDSSMSKTRNTYFGSHKSYHQDGKASRVAVVVMAVCALFLTAVGGYYGFSKYGRGLWHNLTQQRSHIQTIADVGASRTNQASSTPYEYKAFGNTDYAKVTRTSAVSYKTPKASHGKKVLKVAKHGKKHKAKFTKGGKKSGKKVAKLTKNGKKHKIVKAKHSKAKKKFVKKNPKNKKLASR